MDTTKVVDAILLIEEHIRITEKKINKINARAKIKLMKLEEQNNNCFDTVTHLKERMKNYMEENGIAEEEAGQHKAVLTKKAWSVVIPDETLVPKTYIKTQTSVDKAGIKKLLSSGDDLSYASKSKPEYILKIKSNV